MKPLVMFFACAILMYAFVSAAGESCKPIEAPLTFHKIEAALEECKIHHIEELLPLLPAAFRSRYVLVHASRSLQGATGMFPRVILFGLDARLILAFAGSPDLEGYDSLETIEFDDEKKRFNFRRITFSSETHSSKTPVKPQISEPNPERCKMCHRQNYAPIGIPIPPGRACTDPEMTECLVQKEKLMTSSLTGFS
ncbi:hypothetical protein L0156_14975 [bacterium]|nr:hypothetical protein [bacterium]